jgi:Tfp pilus assembly PilM family ATPase
MIGNGKQGWIGVDLGAGAVKVAQIARRRGGHELAGAAIVRREGSLATTSPADCLGDEIRGALSMAEQLRGRRAAGVLSMGLCDFHPVRIADQRVNADVLRSELSAGAPGDWRQRTFDSWPLEGGGGPPGATQPNRGVISLPTAEADLAAAGVASAGLACRRLDSLPAALARALRMMVGDQEITLAAIDWGISHATYFVYKNGSPQYIRRLRRCAFADVIDAVTRSLTCSEEEAAALLQTHGIGNETKKRGHVAELIHDVVQPHLQRLHSELRRTMRYLDSHRRNLKPAGVVIFGVGATMAGFAGWLTGKIGLRAEVWRPNPAALTLPVEPPFPIVLLAPALAASALCWEKP